MTNKSVIKLGEAVKLTRKANELKGSSELQDSTNSNDIVEQNENFDFSGLFSDIESVGNTFCASIPIALNEMKEKNLLKSNDKIILLGYGGGLNTGSILIEI